jgi:polyisoprenoid-binding protein YceI
MHSKLLISIALLAGGAYLAAPQATSNPGPAPLEVAAVDYAVDPGHSGVLFRIKHMGVSNFYGRFNKVEGTYSLNTENPERSTVSIQVDAGSTDTNSKQRDDHINSQDFLNATQYPTILFDSSKVSAHEDKENTFSVTGDLEFHGVTKSVSFDATLVGEADTRMGPRSGFEGELVIQRSDFGMTGMMGALGDEVKLIFFIEGVNE